MRITLFHLGFAEYVMGLANALASHAEVTVIHPESVAATCRTLSDGDIRLISFARPPRRRQIGNLNAMRHAFQLIRESKPDVLHVQEPFDYAYDLFSLFSRLPNLITTIHDVVPHPGDGHAAPGLQYTKAIGCWRSSRLIVHTDGMRVQLSERFHIKPGKIDVIPHGELGSLYQRLAKSGGFAPAERDPYTLLFFGRIWPYKGLRYLLKAFAIVKREIPQARLIIAGRGGDLDTNARLIASLTDVEVNKDFIPEGRVAGLFERASMVVLPYIEASQSGVSAIGFTTGAVVIASRVGGLADLITDQETGVLVAPRSSLELAASIVSMMRNKDRQSRIRKNGYALGASTLNWSVIAEKTMRTYRAAVGE